MKPIVGYMIALLIGTLIVAAVPWISKASCEAGSTDVG